MHPHMPLTKPHCKNPPTLSPPKLWLGARCTAQVAAHRPEHAAQGGGVAHLLRPPRGPLTRSPAAPGTPRECCARRTCTRRCNGRCGRSAACSWRHTCAALSSARATPWQVAGLLCASKMQGGVGECGCKRWQCGEQPLPGTGQNPVPAWDKILPQFRHRQRAHILQQHCYTHVRLG